jgi:hypothetical protein
MGNLTKSKERVRKHANADGMGEFYDTGHGLLQEAIDRYKGTALPKLYDMIADRLYETKFAQKSLTFKGSELCRMTGNVGTNAKRVKDRFVEAAHILFEFHFIHKMHSQRTDFRMIESITETRGGFVIHMTDTAMELFSRMKRVPHDTTLYQLKEQNDCSYGLGRWIENYANDKQKSGEISSVSFTVKAIMNGCASMPDFIRIDQSAEPDRRNYYARRIKWLESIMNDFVEIGFLGKWEWTDGRPTSITQEITKGIRCVFRHPRTLF